MNAPSLISWMHTGKSASAVVGLRIERSASLKHHRNEVIIRSFKTLVITCMFVRDSITLTRFIQQMGSSKRTDHSNINGKSSVRSPTRE